MSNVCMQILQHDLQICIISLPLIYQQIRIWILSVLRISQVSLEQVTVLPQHLEKETLNTGKLTNESGLYGISDYESSKPNKSVCLSLLHSLSLLLAPCVLQNSIAFVSECEDIASTMREVTITQTDYCCLSLSFNTSSHILHIY